ncbi:outer membrane lipoprotein carrier protein LolA [Solimonas sp. K1W22B-7]|uniref:LolA family protein n=1 Tax=Solimonas sp. K1W22B-7 TaxID=2303331 RepID=UPI000E332902|nr:outer membrane lipoprotein carrier protein LolA [Solimonas sp. K1W22B-7]AXQ29294.1 outer membrane lipoprotein carrier protein LolA [Solimonas sp. K1W22B-7]
MINRVFTLLLCLSWSALAGAADLPDLIQRELLDAPLLRGGFEQSKTIAGFRKPLQSSGDFVLSRDEGVLWRTRKPFASTLALTREHVLSRQADGSEVLRVDASRQPAVRAINELLFGLLQGDVAYLVRHQFRVLGEPPKAGSWALELQPTDPLIARLFVRISLQGDHHVRRVRFEETNGDSTEIRFAHLATGPPMSREERAALE